MNRSTVCGFLVPLLLFASSAPGQSTSIHQQIQPIYNFQPQLLSTKEITEKSAALDQLWTRAKAGPLLYIPSLRQELSDFKNPIFFLYDGSTVLLGLSDTPIDRKIVLAAMARCDLRDVQAEDYFLQVHRTTASTQCDTDRPSQGRPFRSLRDRGRTET
jgi:hypothetical protein